MKRFILINILIFSSIIITAQNQYLSEYLYQKLHNEVNIDEPALKSSNIIWERIDVPDSIDIKSFKIFDNELYPGAMFGGAYKYMDDNWVFIGPSYKSVFSFEQYNNDELLLCTNSGFYLWNNDSLILLPGEYYSYANKISDYFLGYNSYEDLHKSIDSCHTWETVLNLSGAEGIRGVTYTSSDSVFIGTTKYTGNGGGVYLSTDSGSTWNHFGLIDHFIASMGVDCNNQVYAGNNGHYETSQGGLYRFNYNSSNWDTLFYFPYITTIIFNTENHIFLGYNLSGMANWGGVMHSEDNGVSWVLDTAGIGNQMVNDIQIDNFGHLYALVGYPTQSLYKTLLPVNIKENIKTQDLLITLYPNPASKTLSIKIDNMPISRNAKIEIFSITGKLLLERDISQIEVIPQNINIDISRFEEGLFLFNIIVHNHKSTIKFIKQ